jgi:hypothetical protein
MNKMLVFTISSWLLGRMSYLPMHSLSKCHAYAVRIGGIRLKSRALPTIDPPRLRVGNSHRAEAAFE